MLIELVRVEIEELKQSKLEQWKMF